MVDDRTPDDSPDDPAHDRSDDESESSPESSGQPRDGGGAGYIPHIEEIHHSQISALVPERAARGVFSTGAVVVQGPHEFIIDFLLRMSQPQQVVARVVLSPGVTSQFISALTENLRHYESKHGPPTVPNAPGAFGYPPHPPEEPVSAEDLYKQLKLTDDVLSGCYANAVMIGHTPNEFGFDFITTFFPRSAVSCRVFLSAPSVPRLLESLRHSFDKFQRRIEQQRKKPPNDPPG